MYFWHQLGTIYAAIGIVIAVALAGWELISHLQGQKGLRFREYPFMMLLAAVTWPWAVPALYKRMLERASEEEAEELERIRS